MPPTTKITPKAMRSSATSTSALTRTPKRLSCATIATSSRVKCFCALQAALSRLCQPLGQVKEGGRRQVRYQRVEQVCVGPDDLGVSLDGIRPCLMPGASHAILRRRGQALTGHDIQRQVVAIGRVHE